MSAGILLAVTAWTTTLRILFRAHNMIIKRNALSIIPATHRHRLQLHQSGQYTHHNSQMQCTYRPRRTALTASQVIVTETNNCPPMLRSAALHTFPHRVFAIIRRSFHSKPKFHNRQVSSHDEFTFIFTNPQYRTYTPRHSREIHMHLFVIPPLHSNQHLS